MKEAQQQEAPVADKVEPQEPEAAVDTQVPEAAVDTQVPEAEPEAPEPEAKTAEPEPVDQARAVHPDDVHKGNMTRSDPNLVPVTRDEALEQVRQVRAANEFRTRARSSVEIVAEVAATSPAGNDNVKPVSIATADGKLYINTHGEKVLDRDGITSLQQKLAMAFQAVS